MKISVVGPAYPLRGGISHYTSLLTGALQANHETKVISFKRLYPSLFFPGKTQIDTSATHIGGGAEAVIDSMNPLTWGAAAERIREFAPDAVLFQWWHPAFAPVYARIARGCPDASKLIFMCHNVVPHEAGKGLARRGKQALTRSAFRHGEAFIVHSEEDRQNLLSLLPNAVVAKSPHPTYSIFNTGSWDREQCRRELDVEGNVILFFGLVRKYKGLSTLIEAMPKVLAKLDATLLVVGECYDDKEPYLKRIVDLCIEDRVRVIDQYVPNEEVGKYFTAADVVALPYLTATQSGIVQIAFGFNKPVIATTVGGLPEVIADGETGLLVPPENPDALAEAIVRYFEEGRGDEFARNISAHQEEFSWERMVGVIERLATAGATPS